MVFILFLSAACFTPFTSNFHKKIEVKSHLSLRLTLHTGDIVINTLVAGMQRRDAGDLFSFFAAASARHIVPAILAFWLKDSTIRALQIK